MSFPRYGSYKDSGVEWLGEVPTHWAIVATKRAGFFTYGDSLPQESRNEQGEVPVFGSNGVFGSHDGSNTKGPVIFIGRKGSCGALNWSAVPSFGIDTVYFVDKDSCRENLRWFYWTLHILSLGTASQDTGVPGLAREFAHNLKIPLPTQFEQTAIAAFLDQETAKIDALVAEQKRLIHLLKEKRHSIIFHATTKGLDPNVPMKDSGIEWLGKIPAHWIQEKVTRNFKASKGRNGQLLTKEYCAEHSGGHPVYSGQTENDGIMGMIDTYEFDFGENGVLFCTTVGAKAMTLRHVKGKLSLSQNCMIIEPTISMVDIRFAYYHFQPLFSYNRSLIPEHMQASFRVEDLSQYYFGLPPLEEQLQITEFLDRKINQIDALAGAADILIELLQERRSALISAAVTGKVDVRTMVPQQAAAE